MVCDFLSPIAPPRSLDGPRFSARWVSLLPLSPADPFPLTGLGPAEQPWRSAYNSLLLRQGDAAAHALLLCSLLLGWGLDAWVAYGTVLGSDHR